MVTGYRKGMQMAVEIDELHLYWYSTKHWKDEKNRGPRSRVVIYPSGQASVQIKLDIAKTINKLKYVKQYYVVAQVTRSDGSTGYRVIVPMVIYD